MKKAKAFFWQQALQLRSNELASLPPDDNHRLTSLFRALERAGIDFDNANEIVGNEWRIKQRRMLNEDAEQLISEIRTRPGFEGFLKIPQFNELHQVASKGPIVILIDNHLLPFAVIVISTFWPEAIRTISLPSLTSGLLDILCKKVTKRGFWRGASRDMSSDAERGLQVSFSSLRAPLGEIWKHIVDPIIQVLGFPVAIIQSTINHLRSHVVTEGCGKRSATSALVSLREVLILAHSCCWTLQR
jgi:hypothetical protein